jgi:hypothetical protein
MARCYGRWSYLNFEQSGHMGLNLGGIHVVKATVSGRLDIWGSLKQIENEYHLKSTYIHLRLDAFRCMEFPCWSISRGPLISGWNVRMYQTVPNLPYNTLRVLRWLRYSSQSRDFDASQPVVLGTLHFDQATCLIGSDWSEVRSRVPRFEVRIQCNLYVDRADVSYGRPGCSRSTSSSGASWLVKQ